jgi:probable rRNA maturation factor
MNAMKTKQSQMVCLMVAKSEADIRINDPVWENWPEAVSVTVERVLDVVCRFSKPGQIDLLLTNDEDIQAINAQWRNKDRPTDVLSFPSDDNMPGNDFLGDIAISHGVMSRDAERMGKTLVSHFSHLLVHGYLHLLGYDHIEDNEASEMEGLEIKILAELGISDPYSTETTA